MRVVLLLMLLAGAVAALAQQPPLRTVTQTVFNQTGKPAARAVVRLSYGWDEMLVLRQGATDAQGTVVWTDVPPVRGVVWGEGIPAGMLPKDGERFTAPLPAPVPEKNFNLGIGMADPGARVVRSYVQSAGRDWQEAGAMYPYRTAAGETVLRNNTFISSGTRVCVAALAQGRPMQLAVSPEFYLPYNDTTSNKPFTLRLAWAAGPTLRGRLVQANRAPLAGVTRLGLAPVELSGVPEGLCALWCKQIGEQRPVFEMQTQPGGAFSCDVPAPGRYRLLVDLFDLEAPAPPALLLAVAPGMADVTVPLPAPLLTAPAGAEVFVHRWTNPGEPDRLVAHALTPQVPIFGSREFCLTYWHRPTPNTLTCWHPLEKAERTLTLRTVILATKEDPGYLTMPRVTSLFPGPTDRDAHLGGPRDYLRTRPELSEAAMQIRHNAPINLWPGRYFLFRGQVSHRELAGVLDIPAAGELAVPLPPLPKKESVPEPQKPMKPIRFAFPEAHYDQLRRQAAPYLHFRFDVPSEGYVTYFASSVVNTTGAPLMPAPATRMTISWPGVGMLRDVALPPAGNERYPTVTLPAWEPGPTVSGTILQADGTPYANAPIRLADGIEAGVPVFPHFYFQTRTDAEGKFSIPGIMPGVMLLYVGTEGRAAAWMRQVPEAGLPNLTLRMAATPMVFPSGSATPVETVWWLPDGQPAERLPMLNTHDVPTVPGWFWGVDGTQGRARFHRFDPAQGLNPKERACPLVLYLPVGAEMPSGHISVALTGQGARAGIVQTFTKADWQPCAVFGLIYTRLSAVPPGDYRVAVKSTGGQTEAAVTVGEDGGYAVLKTMP